MFKNLSRGLLPTYHFADGDGDGAGGDGGGDPISPVNADGSFVENWANGEAYKEHAETLSRYKTFPDMVKSHMDTKKKLGKDPATLAEIASTDSTDEVKASWAKAKGRPDTSDLYEYKLSDEHATKLGPLQDDKMAAFREFAHKQEWNQAQFKEALDFYHTNIASDIDTAEISYNEKREADIVAGKAELKALWLDGTDDRILRANAVMRKYGGEGAIEELGAENNPKMTIFLDNIAEAMSEDTLKGLTGAIAPSASNIMSRISEVRTELGELIKKDPYNYTGNPRYKELMATKKSLYKQKSA